MNTKSLLIRTVIAMVIFEDAILDNLGVISISLVLLYYTHVGGGLLRKVWL